MNAETNRSSHAIEPSAPIRNLLEAINDLSQLSKAHIKHVSSNSDEAIRDIDSVFLKAGLTLLCSAWEAYIEDCAREATVYLVKNIESPDMLPEILRKSVSKQIKDDLNQLAPWKLSGDNWRQFILDRFEETAMEKVNKLNSPNPYNVKQLYNSTLGIEDITIAWQWEMYEQKVICEWIDLFVKARGSVAHGRTPDLPIHTYVIDFLNALIIECAFKTNNFVSDFVQKITLKPFWPLLRSRVDWTKHPMKASEVPKNGMTLIYCGSEGEVYHAVIVKTEG